MGYLASLRQGKREARLGVRLATPGGNIARTGHSAAAGLSDEARAESPPVDGRCPSRRDDAFAFGAQAQRADFLGGVAQLYPTRRST